MNRKSIIHTVKVLLFLLCISGCGGMQPPLTDQWEAYGKLFEEKNVIAELVVHDDTEYLQLTFPDGSVAAYRYGLERITRDLNRMKNGTIASAELELKIKSEKTALVYVTYEDGITNGEFMLPDFSEMLQSRALKQDDSEALAMIESWTSEEEMAALYRQAKNMEQRMWEYQGAE